MNRFTDRLLFVTTNNYNTNTDFHTTSSGSAFTGLCLVTALNGGYSYAAFSVDVSW
jgi:hypothetical protein